MQAKVIGFMSKMQRFKYSAVRILHQEHSNAVLDLAHRGSTFYDRMTHEASPSSSRLLSLMRAKSTSQVQSRSSYWLAQASYLVAIITEGTKFEPKFENTPVMQGACANTIHKSERSFDSVPPSTSSSSEDSPADHEDLSTLGSPYTQSPVSETLAVPYIATTAATPGVTIAQLSLPSPTSNGHRSSKPNPHWDNLEPLPMDRFSSVVDLIFDPNIVHLNRRRAIINCARYVSASIDESLQKSVNTQDPVNPEFFADFQTRYTIKTGPYLTMLAPVRYGDDGSELSPKEQALAGDIKSKVIPPPKGLLNYFQVLLWHRCMSDLIRLYSRIQNRHVDVLPCHRESQPLEMDMTAHASDIYPFCCKAHSLVFTTQYPINIVPYPIRAGLRRMMKMVQSVSQKSILPGAVTGQSESTTAAGRRIQCVGSGKRLNFCNGRAQPPSPTPLNHKRSRSIDDELVQRRYQIEEQTRQDNQVKQELLGLCHMACGLFLIDTQSPDGPSTIMSLLRQGTPWNKGIWREGEWQHDFINQQHYTHQSSNSDPCEGYNPNKTTARSQTSNDSRDMGRWQKLCIAAIQFLAHEELAWGGNRANAELSRLRATSNANAWIYYE
ncbi:hypothetical protein BGX26_008078 [Mortierella sp. AD094]|nr:hypothetical protein BGX26_008078 [Mortierella sp. AD094]